MTTAQVSHGFRMDRRVDFIISGALAVLALAIGAWGVFQVLFMGDHGALTSYVPWGLWVGVYVYLVWLEVGTMLAYTVLRYGLKVEGLEKLGPVVALAALAALSGALFIIAMDLGHPFRFWKAYLQPNFGSLMTWMIWLHTIYLFILVAELFAYRQGKEGLAKRLTFIGAPVGIALIAVIGGLFGVIAARPYWNASVLPLMFFVSSFVAGIALLILLHLLFSPTAGTPQYATTAQTLARVFMYGIVIGLLAAGANALVIAYPGVPAHTEGLRLVLFGPYWWTIWIVHLLFGVLVPLVLLLWNRRSLLNIGIAAGLMVWTFVMVPLNIVIPGLAYPTPELEGLKRAAVHPRLSFDYFPSPTEWLIVVFAVGIALAIFTIGYKLVLEPYQKHLFSSSTSGEQLSGGNA
ncbi:MAG: NrfD/PsrC family molybdoenzyme membrane anchor subunit [Caldilinea sp.]